MEKLSSKQVLAFSSGWVSVLLNILPGLGTGYIYQRRWKAYWLTQAGVAFWLTLGLLRRSGIDAADLGKVQNDQVGVYGLLVIAIITAIEARLAVINARTQAK